MTFLVVLIHILLAVVLFFLINWLGKKSISVGYVSMSIFDTSEGAPIFNFIYRILSPVIYLIIISSILYYFKQDIFVTNIYFASIYYVGIRIAFNLITHRVLLVNWIKELITDSIIVLVSYSAYSSLIIEKKNILPDPSTMANELWIIIILFLFQIFNSYTSHSRDRARRKDRYIKARYLKLYKKYNPYIKENTTNSKLLSLIYAILIYEDYNRPKAIRLIEYISFIVRKRKHTLGIMQVESDKIISDTQSIELGVKKILKSYKDCLPEIIGDKELDMVTSKFKDTGFHIQFMEDQILNSIISDYNGGYKYYYEIKQLYSTILEKFYPNSKDELFMNE